MYPPYGGPGPYGTYGNLGMYGALVPYGSLSLTDGQPLPFAEPLTLAEVKDYLRLPLDLTDQDDTVSALMTAAREQAEILQGLDLVQKQYDLALDYWPAYRIELRAPLNSVDLVQYQDSNGTEHSLTENLDYIVDTKKQGGAIMPMYNKTWPTFQPWPSSAILIRFSSGFANDAPFWSDAGARVKVGMKLLISAWFNNRLPFAQGVAPTQTYEWGIVACLTHGAVSRVR